MGIKRFSLEKHWDDFKNKKLAVNCKTEELAKEFLKYCYEKGMKWKSGTSLLEETYWDDEDKCYEYGMFCAPMDYYVREGFGIVDFQGFSQHKMETVLDKFRPYLYFKDGYTYYVDKMIGYIQLMDADRVVFAKCDGNDIFDLDFGIELVMARFTDNKKKEKQLLESKYPSEDEIFYLVTYCYDIKNNNWKSNRFADEKKALDYYNRIKHNYHIIYFK